MSDDGKMPQALGMVDLSSACRGALSSVKAKPRATKRGGLKAPTVGEIANGSVIQTEAAAELHRECSGRTRVGPCQCRCHR